MAPPIEVSAEPVDEARCKFILSRPVFAPGAVKYTSVDDAAESPVAQAVLSVPGVCEVVVSGNVLTAVTSEPHVPWETLEPQVRYAVNAGAARLEQEAPGMLDAPTDDDDIYDVVDEVFRTQINPAVASHGGKIELIDVQDATVVVRLMGGCQGCGMANVTLRQGVESALKRAVPTIRGIKDITDHSAGSNPYFQAGTK
jgi:Fe-S cluster biogenesis protein NfuA